MTTIARRSAAALVLLALTGCGASARHHLGDYSYADRSMAVVIVDAPTPAIRTNGLEMPRSASDVVGSVVQAGAAVAKDVEARRARERLDSAAARAAFVEVLAARTAERAGRYLGVRTVPAAANADFLLEVRLADYGIDARGTGPASVYSNAQAVLLDRASGREIWSVKVQGSDELSPRVRGGRGVVGSVVAAGALRGMTVADFQDALDQLATVTANVTADELRAALRDVRR